MAEPTSPTSQALLNLVSSSSHLASSARLYLHHGEGNLPTSRHDDLTAQSTVSSSTSYLTTHGGNNGGQVSLSPNTLPERTNSFNGKRSVGIDLDETTTVPSSISIPSAVLSKHKDENVQRKSSMSLPSSPSKGSTRRCNIESLRAEIIKLKENNASWNTNAAGEGTSQVKQDNLNSVISSSQLRAPLMMIHPKLFSPSKHQNRTLYPVHDTYLNLEDPPNQQAQPKTDIAISPPLIL